MGIVLDRVIDDGDSC